MKWLLLLLALPAQAAAAQATVSGVVHDSIASAPLSGAMVQLVSADSIGRYGSTAIADSLGRFSIAAVPRGRYNIGFFHPMLDSLGMDPTVREVRVEGTQTVRADLAIPSAGRFRAAVCGAQADAGGMVMGVVREARDSAPAAGVAVKGEWLELTIGAGGVGNRVQRLVATTGENGRYVLCNVPNQGTVMLAASRGADSTDRIETQIPAEALLRRDLYLGAKSGGRLTGVVTTSIGGQPLKDAQVTMPGTPPALANERGEWSLPNVPLGTRMIEVRAVGYYPEKRVVDVVSGAAPLRVSLSTLTSVLDTVKVTAARVRGEMVEVQTRVRASAGRLLAAEDIAKRNPIVTSDLFKSFSGVKLGFASDTTETDMNPVVNDSGPPDRRILMRGISGGWCVPAIYLDGVYFDNLQADDIDSWVNPKNVLGIEVYTSTSVPAQFQRAMSGCGAVLFWTKR